MSLIAARKGEKGMEIALVLWRDLRRATHAEDLQGIDAYGEKGPISVKVDATIAVSGNVFHEVYKRNDGVWNSFGNRGDWRPSPMPLRQCEYIFVSDGIALRIPISILAVAERGKPLVQIKSTAIGFLIPIKELTVYDGVDVRRGAWRIDGGVGLSQ